MGHLKILKIKSSIFKDSISTWVGFQKPEKLEKKKNTNTFTKNKPAFTKPPGTFLHKVLRPPTLCVFAMAQCLCLPVCSSLRGCLPGSCRRWR